jgi:hypothetical protein
LRRDATSILVYRFDLAGGEPGGQIVDERAHVTDAVTQE